jgi:hypothetical protein
MMTPLMMKMLHLMKLSVKLTTTMTKAKSHEREMNSKDLEEIGLVEFLPFESATNQNGPQQQTLAVVGCGLNSILSRTLVRLALQKMKLNSMVARECCSSFGWFSCSNSTVCAVPIEN